MTATHDKGGATSRGQRIKRFTIDRARWLRGDLIEEDAALLSPMGRQCCLGFYLEACGVPRGELRDETVPSNLGRENLPAQAQWLAESSTATAPLAEDEFTTLNDDSKIGERERESRLMRLFRKRKIAVRFVGRLTKTDGPLVARDDEDYFDDC